MRDKWADIIEEWADMESAAAAAEQQEKNEE